MPIYNYKCACERTFSELRKINDDGAGEAECVCGDTATRVVARTRFYLRADGTQKSGWANPGMSDVDYRKKGRKGSSSSSPKGRGTHLKYGY